MGRTRRAMQSRDICVEHPGAPRTSPAQMETREAAPAQPEGRSEGEIRTSYVGGKGGANLEIERQSDPDPNPKRSV